MTDEAPHVEATHVRRVQSLYPRIWHACHTRHTHGASTGDAPSDRESQVLAHLDETRATQPATLARHMGLAKSTLSELLEGLEARGYVRRSVRPEDRRRHELFLTKKGARAFEKSAALDARRLRAVLARLSEGERRRAVTGLALLARACGEELAHRGRRRASW